MSSWWWRTKPRSIIKTVQWFKEFGKLDGKNWNELDKSIISKLTEKNIHPVRREYIYNAHREEDAYLNSLTFSQYLNGQFDIKETESNGRNDKTTYEFFGFAYVDKNGVIKITDVGQLIINNAFDSEDFLKQLLKLYFPNYVSNKNDMDYDNGIFPMEILLQAINKFGYLNRSEIVFLFGCTAKNKINTTLKAIEKFRNKYDNLDNKNDINKIKELCENIFKETFGSIDNQIGSYYDYAEAFCRSLSYTGLFKLTGRSIATKVRVAEYSIPKVQMLIDEYNFEIKHFSNIDDYMEWYGCSDATLLPWDNPQSRKELILNKINYLENIDIADNIQDIYGISIRDSITTKVKEIRVELERATDDGSLKLIEKEIVSFVTNLNERKYIETLATTSTAREEILSKYDDILDNDDMSALWLEVNTWKSLLAIKGEKTVKRNFNIEEDLTPKSFAPGVGNTPDMELYTEDYIILPEVSLMSGVRQWEHEASSVIDHVLSFIDAYQAKKVFGLFITTSINIRTNWQFFILNRESWVGSPVPVIPLTIKQYCSIIKSAYSDNKTIDSFIKLLEDIHTASFSSTDFNNWNANSNRIIQEWINSK